MAYYFTSENIEDAVDVMKKFTTEDQERRAKITKLALEIGRLQEEAEDAVLEYGEYLDTIAEDESEFEEMDYHTAEYMDTVFNFPYPDEHVEIWKLNSW